MLTNGNNAVIKTWSDTMFVFIMPAGFSESQSTVEVIINNQKINIGKIWTWEANIIQLTDEDVGVTTGEPTWSPNDKYIYYTLKKPSKSYDIYRIPSSGGKPEQLTNTAYNENWPDIDFHSGYIAYGTDSKDFGNSQGDYEIWISGGSLGPLAKNLSTDDRHDSNPAWPLVPTNGITMAFSSEDEKSVPIIKLNTSLNNIIELTNGFSPRFNPNDNKWIVYAKHSRVNATVYKIDISSRPNAVPVPLTSSQMVLGVSDWGVNKKILYTRSDGSSDIWVMDDDGKNKMKLIGTNDPEYSGDGHMMEKKLCLLPTVMESLISLFIT